MSNSQAKFRPGATCEIPLSFPLTTGRRRGGAAYFGKMSAGAAGYFALRSWKYFA